RDSLGGIEVPGGWITLGLGAGLLGAAATASLHRRHRHQLAPITNPRLDDADLQPPPGATTRIRASLRGAATASPDEQPPTAPTAREDQSAALTLQRRPEPSPADADQPRDHHGQPNTAAASDPEARTTPPAATDTADRLPAAIRVLGRYR